MKWTNMQGGARRRYYTRYLAHYTKKNHRVLLLGAIFAAGVLLGTLLVRTAGGETLQALLRLIGNFSERRREQGFAENVMSGSMSGLAILVALFVGGFCAIAQPAVVCVPLLRGLGFGFSTASLYAAYGSGAAGFIGLFLLPGMLISTIAMLFCCNEALRLSGRLRALLWEKEAQPYSLRIYCARFVTAGALWFLSALLEAALYAAFPAAFLL